MIQLFQINNAIEVLKLLILNGITPTNNVIKNQNTSNVVNEAKLISLATSYNGLKDLLSLIVGFAQCSGIYLIFIGYIDGKFNVLNEYSNIITTTVDKTSYIVLNGNETICGPLFFVDQYNRKKMVFRHDDMFIKNIVNNYVDQLNGMGNAYS